MRWSLSSTVLLVIMVAVLPAVSGEVTEALLTGHGSGQKEYQDPEGWWQNIRYELEVSFRLGVRFALQDNDLIWYDIVHQTGSVRFWGTAEDHFFGSTEIWNFDDTHNYDRTITDAVLAYSLSEERVVYAGFPLSENPAVTWPYHMRYFAEADPHIVRAFIALPTKWFFDEVYDVPGTAELVLAVQVVDPNPRLLDADHMTGDVARLAVGGDLVRGLAADGLTPVLLRIKAPGETSVEFSIRDDGGSGDPASVGVLSSLDGQAANPLSVDAQDVDGAWMAFAVLTAPEDFARDGRDAGIGERPLRLEVAFGTGERVARTIALTRPPLMLIHGLWSSADAWKLGIIEDQAFTIYAQDYRPTNSYHFLWNVSQARAGVERAVRKLRKKLIACTRADVLGHSMGGLLSRLYVADATMYERADNLGKGDVHKLITLDTPHLGSPLADWLVDGTGKQTWLGFLVAAATGNCMECGAVEDLRTDSGILLGLPAAEVPAHAIVGTGGSDLIEAAALDVLEDYPPTKPAAVLLEILQDLNIIGKIFPPQLQHDLIVGRKSQEGGLATDSPPTSVIGFEPSPLGLPLSWGIHITVNWEERTDEIVRGLLDTRLRGPLFAQDGFPGRASLGGSPALAVRAAPGLMAGEGSLSIASPLAGGVVTAGESMTVRVVADGFQPVSVLIVCRGDVRLVSEPPFEGELIVPGEAAGEIPILAAGLDAEGKVVLSKETRVRVAVASPMTGLIARPDSLVVFAYASAGQVAVIGTFEDGVERDLSASVTGTTYTVADPSIAGVDAEGMVTGRRMGTTVVTIRNGAFSATFDTVVETAKGDPNRDGKVDGTDLDACAACLRAAAEQGQSSVPLSCLDFFDYDFDLDIDGDDLAAFLLSYEGEITDCNQNGALDLQDVLMRTSRDCNRNWIPDECDIASGASKDLDGDSVPDECSGPSFERGDANADGQVNIGDPIFILFHLFAAGDAPHCEKSADADGNGDVQIVDAVYILHHLFTNGSPPPSPAGKCGPDPFGSALSCESFPPCN